MQKVGDDRILTTWWNSYNPGTAPTPNPYIGFTGEQLAQRYPLGDKGAKLDGGSLYVLTRLSPPLFYFVAVDRNDPNKIYVQGSNLGMVYCEMTRLL
jgi:hypothetical protein